MKKDISIKVRFTRAETDAWIDKAYGGTKGLNLEVLKDFVWVILNHMAKAQDSEEEADKLRYTFFLSHLAEDLIEEASWGRHESVKMEVREV